MRVRCPWCGSDPLYVKYHDEEWAVPVRDDRKLFEFLILEGAQAGLSWLTVLKRREGYRLAYEGFDPVKVARFDKQREATLREDSGIIRNRLKIAASITNARAFLEVQEAWGSFSDYIWSFLDGEPIQNHWREMSEVPATTPLSDRISKDLNKRGFRFVGSTIVYAHMQATGMVNDHIISCFRHRQIADL